MGDFYNAYIFEDIGGPNGITAEKLRVTFGRSIELGYEGIILHMLTIGGLVDEANKIVDLMKEHRSAGYPIIAFNRGVVASSGVTIMSAADYAYGSKDSMTLIHNAWANRISGDSAKLRLVADHLDLATEPSIEVYTKKTGRTREEVIELMKREDYLNEREAVEFGLLDGVYDKKLNTIEYNAAKSYLDKVLGNPTDYEYSKELVEVFNNKFREEAE